MIFLPGIFDKIVIHYALENKVASKDEIVKICKELY